MIRKALIQDLDGVLAVLKSVGNNNKDPHQGFLMNDYSRNEEAHRQKYARDLAALTYCYVYEGDSGVEAFLIAYTIEEWLKEVPDWLSAIYWRPGFDNNLLEDAVLINQTAMYPHLTGQGIGSRLYEALAADLRQRGIKGLFAETIIGPVPNLASLHFRLKQKYELVGMRYETHANTVYTTLIYYKPVPPAQD